MGVTPVDGTDSPSVSVLEHEDAALGGLALGTVPNVVQDVDLVRAADPTSRSSLSAALVATPASPDRCVTSTGRRGSHYDRRNTYSYVI